MLRVIDDLDVQQLVVPPSIWDLSHSINHPRNDGYTT